MQKLFISFTSLLPLVAEGHVSDDDLRTGLFFFSCRRSHALEPGKAGERVPFDGKFQHVHARIVEALLLAETDHRAAWHNVPDARPNSWDVLNELLGNNYHSSLAPNFDLSSHYCYPAVRDAVVNKGLALEVVY